MELCDSCKNKNCNKSIVIIEEPEMTTYKCLEYQKGEVESCKEHINRTAKQRPTLMRLNI